MMAAVQRPPSAFQRAIVTSRLRDRCIAVSVSNRSSMTCFSTPFFGRPYKPLPPVLEGSLKSRDDPILMMSVWDADPATGRPWICSSSPAERGESAHIVRGGRVWLSMVFYGLGPGAAVHGKIDLEVEGIRR